MILIIFLGHLMLGNKLRRLVAEYNSMYYLAASVGGALAVVQLGALAFAPL